MDFYIELLNQRITQREYDSALVCALAVQGVTPTGWREPGLYTAILSAIIKVGRFMVVQKALEMGAPEEDGEFSNGGSAWDFEDSAYGSDADSSRSSSRDSRDSRDSRGSRGSSGRNKRSRMSCLELIKQIADSFMVQGSHSPIQWILDLRTYGMKIHYNTTTKGHIGWNGREQLLYQGIQFTMAKFRGMVHGLLHDTHQLLISDLLMGGESSSSSSSQRRKTGVPAVPWDSIRDNPAEERRGWSFLQDQRTRLPVDGRT